MKTATMTSTDRTDRKRTLCHLQKRKQTGEKIAVVTTYDATFSRMFSELGLDVMLVGDSVGMTIGGHDTTVPVTMRDMIYHTQNVCRPKPKSFIISDLPF